MEPFFDDDMENHLLLQGILSTKPRGKGQQYLYDIPDKNCNLIISHQMEKAIREKDIIDITMAQRSEKILVRLNDGTKVTVPVASYQGEAPLYRGSGWTKGFVEEEHHHGKETMSIAKLFEAKEQGVEEWELEMMRMATKRKRKVRGEESVDWKQMLAGCLENMDWDKFEEDSKQIVEEVAEPIEEENIPMEVDDMEKTRHVNEKLIEGGEDILAQLPTMKEIPQVIKNLDSGELCEMVNVSGVKVSISEERTCFVTGQMVKTEENEVFMPGQTVENDDGTTEYTPGITIYMENEPTLVPGLVFGEEEDEQPIFLPGESTITEKGQLKFEVREEDIPPIVHRQFSTSSESSSPPPEPKPKPKPKQEEEIVIRRRVIEEPPPEPVVNPLEKSRHLETYDPADEKPSIEQPKEARRGRKETDKRADAQQNSQRRGRRRPDSPENQEEMQRDEVRNAAPLRARRSGGEEPEARRDGAKHKKG